VEIWFRCSAPADCSGSASLYAASWPDGSGLGVALRNGSVALQWPYEPAAAFVAAAYGATYEVPNGAPLAPGWHRIVASFFASSAARVWLDGTELLGARAGVAAAEEVSFFSGPRPGANVTLVSSPLVLGDVQVYPAPVTSPWNDTTFPLGGFGPAPALAPYVQPALPANSVCASAPPVHRYGAGAPPVVNGAAADSGAGPATPALLTNTSDTAPASGPLKSGATCSSVYAYNSTSVLSVPGAGAAASSYAGLSIVLLASQGLAIYSEASFKNALVSWSAPLLDFAGYTLFANVGIGSSNNVYNLVLSDPNGTVTTLVTPGGSLPTLPLQANTYFALTIGPSGTMLYAGGRIWAKVPSSVWAPLPGYARFDLYFWTCSQTGTTIYDYQIYNTTLTPAQVRAFCRRACGMLVPPSETHGHAAARCKRKGTRVGRRRCMRCRRACRASLQSRTQASHVRRW
jgi:hypothetical protein